MFYLASSSDDGSGPNAGQTVLEVKVPREAVGAVIGPQGSVIKAVRSADWWTRPISHLLESFADKNAECQGIYKSL